MFKKSLSCRDRSSSAGMYSFELTWSQPHPSTTVMLSGCYCMFGCNSLTLFLTPYIAVKCVITSPGSKNLKRAMSERFLLSHQTGWTQNKVMMDWNDSKFWPKCLKIYLIIGKWNGLAWNRLIRSLLFKEKQWLNRRKWKLSRYVAPNRPNKSFEIKNANRKIRPKIRIEI